MPLSSPDGYLEFTNAVPRAVKMVATSNVGIGTSAPEYALDVHGTSNTGPLTVSSLTITDGAIGGDVSFSGNLAFTSDVTTSVDSNVVVEHRGPHGRDGAAVLKKYPEIVFEEGKFDRNDTTNTYTQAGYTVTASSTYSTYSGWKVFDGVSNVDTSSWYSGDNLYNGGTPVGTGSGSSQLDTNVDVGEYLVITLPFKIKASYALISPRTNGNYSPKSGKFYAYDGTNWVELSTFTNKTYTPGSFTKIDIDSTTFYEKFAIVSTEITATTSTYTAIGELQLYGYEEDPPAGDTSIDTTFTSVMNTPQTTGANVYVDAKLSTDFTNQVTGPTPVGTAATHNDTGKYWELTGELTSNVTVEANTFLEGDQPHAVSVWFNSSNLEANTANTCVFTISDQENLDSYNLDLQSNTWHNLTYSYQGEGGSRVTYLDGRKVAEDQAEDTFGDYPPFAMTGYSQGGYVVSSAGGSDPWKAFNNTTTDNNDRYFGLYDVTTSYYTTGTGYFNTTGYPDLKLSASSGTPAGDWISIEMPHKLKLDTFYLKTRSLSSGNSSSQRLNGPKGEAPRDFEIWGTNDDVNWYLVKAIIDAEAPNTKANVGEDCADPRLFAINASKSYKKFAMIVTRNGSTYSGATATTVITIGEMSFYGHRENDLVRLPDPTNVLKYPHIPFALGRGGYLDAIGGITRGEQSFSLRGYTVTSSSNLGNGGTDTRSGWNAFDEGRGGTTYSIWQSGDYYVNNTSPGTYNRNPPQRHTAGGVNYDGEWIKLELPHKINVTSIEINSAAYTDLTTHIKSRPYEGAILGSNDDSTWDLLKAFSGGLTWTTTTIAEGGGRATLTPDTNTGNAYKYLVLIVNKNEGPRGQFDINEIRYYGTGVDSVPIQIGGGNIDKVANFRVYDKFIGEDQALEIWDAQKDTFRGVKNSMTLHKGYLGLGTEEPEGRLAVADEPDPDTYGLQEYPPKPLAGYKTHIEGHGEFCVKVSSNNGDSFAGWKAFNKIFTGGEGWMTGGDPDTYTQGTGLPNSATAVFNGKQGEWLHIELPYKIRLKKTTILQRTSSDHSRPTGSFTIWGSNDTFNWDEIITGTHTRTVADNETTGDPINRDIDTSKFYSSYAFQIHNIIVTSGNEDMGHVAEWKLFGYREQVTKQSVLHDGQLTLTKNLTVPRIGPPLDADDTPRRDRLVVEYNTSSNPTFEGAVRDTSGRGNDGVFYNGASYNATKKAFEFDGTDDYVVSGYLGIPTGAFVHSVSLWFKRDSLGSNMFLSVIGGESDPTNTRFTMMLQDSPDEGNIHLSISGSNSYFSSGITTGVWFHVVYTYNGGAQGSASTAHTVYVNGVKKAISGGTGSGTLNLPENSRVALGSQPWGYSNFLDGSISNFKLYDKILTAQEVKTLYDMGRCDEGHHVVNFSKTRVGIGLGDGEAPTYTLDVRGQIRSQGSLVTSFTGQHKCVPEEPMETGLIVSAKKNQYVKLNGSLDTGKSAITIDESLPVVSLSSVDKDKACFGVVSSMEEANSLVRIETVGGVISDAPKTLGDNRAIVNSVGEGAIWVVNTGGPLESGDYITTSNVAGYGQKQEDDVLHNYTVAKITMDCDFTGSNVAVQTIKREETGLRTITEDVWNTLVDYDRSSATETQYSNTLDPEAYSGQSGYTPREVTTIVDYTDGSNTISVEEWSALSPEEQETYQSNTTTEIVDYIKFVTAEEWSSMDPEVQATYTEVEIITYYQIMRGENILDENGQLQWEDKTGATESPYERRFLDTDGVETDEANAAHIAAFVGCTYHCG